MKAESLHRAPRVRPRSATRRDLLTIVLGAGLLFFVSLGARDLWNPNEPIYGRAVAEMTERGDWLIPTVNGRVFAEKPILYFWAALASAELLGGVDELSLRLPTATAALASAVLVYLLVLPYAGRRRAGLTVALFATLFQVFWAARAVQMDVLVLASTLGILVPLTRLLDFGARPLPAFAWAGLAAGLGFLAKGPVTLVVPGIALLGYAAATRRIRHLLRPSALLGVAVAVAVAVPWLAWLALAGQTDFLYEVLFRQNVTRFLDAWDHQQPWWYYLKYLWIDYAPWSLLLPAAALTAARDDDERNLHRLSWVWILAVIAFFSLSDSKRAPYILPIAPAVAILASGVVERWIFGSLEPRARRLARWTLTGVALAMVLAGEGMLLAGSDVPRELTRIAWSLAAVLITCGLAVGYGVVVRDRQAALAPAALLAGIASLYAIAAVWALPAVDPYKSARGFATAMNQRIQATNGTLASYLFWSWRSGYSYYGHRSIPGLDSPADLEAFWRGHAAAHVLVEDDDRHRLTALLPDAELVLEGKIGSRSAFLYAKHPISRISREPAAPRGRAGDEPVLASRARLEP